jgi:signal transduction histidine kinase
MIAPAAPPRSGIESPTDGSSSIGAPYGGLSESELRELRHEVGNALAPVAAYAQLLLRDLPASGDDPRRRALEVIRRGVLDACVLLGVRELVGHPLILDLREAVGRAADCVPPERRDDLRIGVLADAPLVAPWDAGRIQQILLNLLGNAAKYSRPGTPIEVELARAGTWARITVRDHGIGVEPAELPAIFEGHRTNAARQTAPGSGMGLRLCRRLVELERGRLWAISTPGWGSAFCVDLPLVGRAAVAERLAIPPGG